MTGVVGDPVIVALPGEVDLSNSETLCTQLCAALDTAGGVVVVDMTPTVFCDSSGFRMLLVVGDRAAENGVQLRVAASAGGPVLRALGLMGFDRVLDIFPSLHEALAPAASASGRFGAQGGLLPPGRW
jgi:anti-sigma B factor antagonist